MDGGDGVELLLPALVGFAVVAVEASFDVDALGSVLGSGGPAVGHPGDARGWSGAGLSLIHI